MNLTINGRQVTVDDSFRDLPREDQEAAVEHIADSMPKKEASGVAAGAIHGALEPIHGAAETLKRFAGVGPGRQDYDPNYVPARRNARFVEPRELELVSAAAEGGRDGSQHGP
jgi:hypothetical protein